MLNFYNIYENRNLRIINYPNGSNKVYKPIAVITKTEDRVNYLVYLIIYNEFLILQIFDFFDLLKHKVNDFG